MFGAIKCIEHRFFIIKIAILKGIAHGGKWHLVENHKSNRSDFKELHV